MPICVRPHCFWNLLDGDKFCWGCGRFQGPTPKPRKKPAAPKTKTTTPTRGPGRSE